MSDTPKYVPIKAGEVLIRQDQHELVTRYCEARRVSVNQAVRDLLDLPAVRAFFSSVVSTHGTIPPMG